MATFNNSKFFPTDLKDIRGVVNDTREHFIAKGYDVNVEDSSFGSFISLSNGGIFKLVLGMKTSLNIEIKFVSGGISVDARVGIFGQQIIPTLITWFILWPVLLTQITGLVKQAKLDDEVLSVIESAIIRYQNGALYVANKEFCASCGASINTGSSFCHVCGAKQV